MRWSLVFFILVVLGLNSRLALYAQENEEAEQQEIAAQAEQEEAVDTDTQEEAADDEAAPEESEEESAVADDEQDAEADTADQQAAEEQEAEVAPEDADTPDEEAVAVDEAEADSDADDDEQDAQVVEADAAEQETKEEAEVAAEDEQQDDEQEVTPKESEEADVTPDEKPEEETIPEVPEKEPVPEITPEEDTEETPAPEVEAEEEPDEIAVPKIDTVGLEEPKGNWLLKRYWWMEAERKYGKIKALVDGIFDRRTTFTTKRNELDRDIFDPFYRTVGISQGELQVTINNLIEQLETERQEDELSADERELLEMVEAERATLQELQKEVDSIVSMEDKVDEALSKLYEQINRVRSYSTKAWDTLKQIARELSDAKAHELYLSMEAILKNVKGIEEYIQGPYTRYFDELAQKAQDEIDHIKSTVEQLKEKGIDLTKKVEEYEQEETLATEKERKAKEEEAIRKAVAKTKAELSFGRRIASFFTTTFAWIGHVVSWPFTTVYNMFFAQEKKHVEPKEEKADQEETVGQGKTTA